MTEEGDESKKKINEPDAEDDGEVKDAEEGKKGEASETLETKLPGLEEKKEPEAPKTDFSLLDQLIDSFIDIDGSEMLPVLCGYFNKIIQALLTKEKPKILDYLFI